MEYREYEAILAKLHEVGADDMPAFTGRLRVLQDRAGIPLASRPGKGTRRQFSKMDLWETHLALRLAEAGLPPHRIGLLFSRWLRPQNTFKRVDDHSGDDDLYMIILTHLNAGRGSETEGVSHSVALCPLDQLPKHFRHYPTSEVQSVLNISKLTSEI
jgi:hypothetical protein